MDTNTVLRIVDSVQSTLHPWMTEEGALVRFFSASPGPRSLTYYDVSTLDGSHTSGGWLSGRFEVVEPQPITGPLPAGTLLRCVEQDHWGDGVYENAFYRIIDDDECDAFIRVASLDGEPVRIAEGTVPFGFYPRRFVYYPDSAPAEPTTEKGTTMSNTTTLDRSTAATLPIGARVVFTDSGERNGKVFILDRAGIDVDGDFHGSFDGSDYNHFLNWSYFSLPHGDLLQSTPSGDEWKAKFERLIAALAEEAERREWCPQFDSFMEDNGFEGLCGTLRTFTVNRTATVEWKTTVEARSQEHAERLARELDDPGYIYSIEEQDRYGDVSNVEVESVEEA